MTSPATHLPETAGARRMGIIFGLAILTLLALLATRQAGAAAPVQPATNDTTLLYYVRAGGPLSYVLVGLSIVALSLVIRNLLALRMSNIAPEETVKELERFLRANDFAGAQQFCLEAPESSLLTNIFGSALERCASSPFGSLELRTAIEDAAQSEVDQLHRMNDGLGIIAAVGPMLGLLGTVIGMIGAFNAIGALEGAARSSELAKYMSLALVNTAEGLIVAVPCTVAFALFRRRINRLTGQAGRIIERLLNAVSARTGIAAPQRPQPQRAPAPALAPRPVAEGNR